MIKFIKNLIKPKTTINTKIEVNTIFEWKTEINGIKKPHFYLYPFCDNGLSLLVRPMGNGLVFDIINDFLPDGRYSVAPAPIGNIWYNNGGGVDYTKEQMDELYKAIEKITL